MSRLLLIGLKFIKNLIKFETKLIEITHLFQTNDLQKCSEKFSKIYLKIMILKIFFDEMLKSL